MGDRKRRRRAFFVDHPLCCFCGGGASAITEDHVPARSIFDGRNWPEGYAFPACEACNAITRDDEKVMALLARLRNHEDIQTDLQRAEMRRAMSAVRRSFPDAYESMQLSANQVRGFLRDTGRERPANISLREIPVVSVGAFMGAIRSFAIKLFCALHYKHTGLIVPRNGAIVSKLYSNAQVHDGELPEELLKMVGSRPTLVRASRELHNQFTYMYSIGEDGAIGIFVVGLRDSFVLMGAVLFTDTCSATIWMGIQRQSSSRRDRQIAILIVAGFSS